MRETAFENIIGPRIKREKDEEFSDEIVFSDEEDD